MQERPHSVKLLDQEIIVIFKESQTSPRSSMLDLFTLVFPQTQHNLNAVMDGHWEELTKILCSWKPKFIDGTNMMLLD